MKIIQLGNSRLPSEKAHTRQIIEMANALQSHYDSVLCLPKRYQDNSSLKNIQYDKFYNISKLNIKFLFGFDDIYLNKKIGMKSFLYIFRMLLNFLHLIVILNKKEDFIYSRELLLTILLRIFGYKTIFEMHQFDTKDMSKNTVNKLFKFLSIFNKKDFYIVAISKNLKDKILTNCNYNKLKIFVLHDAYRPIKTHKFLEKKNLYDFCYCGQLFESKGIKVIIETARLLPDKKFLIIGGDKKLVSKYLDICNNINIKNIKFLGFLEPLKLDQSIECSKILILPQIDETAESPLKLFEYLSYGKPIFASKTKPIAEILKNRKNALLFYPGSAQDLVNLINLNYDDKNLLKFISKNAKIDSLKFTWSERAKKLYNIFNKVI